MRLTRTATIVLLIVLAHLPVAPSMAGGEPIPCLLAGGLSFVPVDLFPEALRVKITDSPPPFAIEGLKSMTPR